MAAFSQDTQYFTKQVFLKAFSTIYVFAFYSLYVQVPGLYGRHGLLPAQIELKKAEGATLSESFKNKPTLLWFADNLGLSTETCMEAICILGIVIALLAAIARQFRNAVSFAVLWFLYFSVYQVGQTFLWFQWDILLLETGFIAIFVADLKLGHQKLNTCGSLNLWLMKWLLFRLMFASGVVKLTSKCPTWWGLTALNYHYESQCIPTPLAWYAHQLPEWFQRLSVALTTQSVVQCNCKRASDKLSRFWFSMFVIEIGLPFLFFAPIRWLRLFSFYAQVFFQVLIILTGNYNFFNLLTVVLCISLLDDVYFGYGEDYDDVQYVKARTKRWLPIDILMKVVKVGVIGFTLVATLHCTIFLFNLKVDNKKILSSRVGFSQRQFFKFLRIFVPLSIGIGVVSLLLEIAKAIIRSLLQASILQKIFSATRAVIFSGIAVWLFCVSLVPYTDIERTSQENIWPIIYRWHTKMDNLQVANSYGLFRSMTGVGGRPEIVIEGSNSLKGPWKEYEFRYKPGKLKSPLVFCTPHQPRLDWQMWFAALGSYQHNPWFINLIDKLLEGEESVLKLLGSNPFPKTPPKFIKSTLYKYHFTHLPRNTSGIVEGLKKSRSIGKWWWRDGAEEYTPPLEKDNQHVKKFLQHFGLSVTKDEVKPATGNIHELILSLRCILHPLDPTLTMLSLAIAVYLSSIYRYLQ